MQELETVRVGFAALVSEHEERGVEAVHDGADRGVARHLPAMFLGGLDHRPPNAGDRPPRLLQSQPFDQLLQRRKQDAARAFVGP